MERPRRYVGFVRGNPQDLDRERLKSEFSKFGKVTKIFIDANKTFAKVYLEDQNSLQQACSALNNSNSWNIVFAPDSFGPASVPPPVPNGNIGTHLNRDLNTSASSSGSAGASQAKMDDDYIYDDCTMVSGFVDVHGNNLDVLQGDGRLYVNLADVKRAGFSIFKKNDYIPEAIDNRQKLREFELHLLSEAKKYLLTNSTRLKEEDILETIERVKSKLLAASYPVENGLVRPPPARFQDHAGNSPAGHQRRQQEQPGHLQAIANSNQWQQGKQPLPYEFNRQPKQLDGKFSVAPRGFQPNRHGAPAGDRQGPRDKPPAMYTKNYPEQAHLRKPIAAQSAFAANNNDDHEESWDEDAPKNTSRGSNKSNGNVSKWSAVSLEPIDKIKLKPNEGNRVKVCYIMERPDKSPIYYVNLEENGEILEKLLLDLNSGTEWPTIAPEVGKLCLASHEDIWYRAHVTNLSPLRVDLLDYGNREVTHEPIKKLPDEFKSIPGQAVRCTLNEDAKLVKPLAVDDIIVVIPKRQFEGGTYLIELGESSPKPAVPKEAPKNGEPPKKVEEPPKTFEHPLRKEVLKKLEDHKKLTQEPEEKAFLTVLKPCSQLGQDDKVMVADFKDGVIYMRNRDCAVKMKEMKQYIDAMEKKPVSGVKPGQMVLCSRDGLLGVHRAMVVKTDGIAADVDYIDYTGSEKLSIKSLRNVDEHLSKIPQLILASPKIDIGEIGENAAGFLEGIMDPKNKFVVDLSGGKFDLTLEGESLTATLKKLNEKEREAAKMREQEAAQVAQALVAGKKASEIAEPGPSTSRPKPGPSKPQPKPAGAAPPKVMYDQMKTVQPQPGRAEYMLYSVNGGDVTLLSTDETSMDHLTFLLEYKLDPALDVPYEPEPFEMCLTMFDGTWSRATVVTRSCAGLYALLFVDFGNEGEREAKDLRRFPEELGEIPVLGIDAAFTGIPKTKEVLDKLKSLIQDSSIHEIDIKSVDKENVKCLIEVPSIYAELRSAGLM